MEREEKKIGDKKPSAAMFQLRRSTKKYSQGGIATHYIKNEGNMKVKMVVL